MHILPQHLLSDAFFEYVVWEMIRTTVNVRERDLEALDAWADENNVSRAAAGGILIGIALQVSEDEAHDKDPEVQNDDELRADARLIQLMQDRINELLHDKSYLEGLLAQASHEKQLILQTIPQLPAPRESWWQRVWRPKDEQDE